MTRVELLAEFKAQSWVKTVGDMNELGTDYGVKIYELPYLDSGEKTATKRTATIYVVDENQDTEEAFFKDTYPESVSKDKSAITEKYEQAASDLKLNLVSEGDSFNVYEGYETVDGVVKAVRYIADMDEYRKMYID